MTGTSAVPPLFDSRFLATLEQLRLASSRVAGGSGRGNRLSRHRGRGLEFADYRPYAQGDDFRHIDWPAYRRLNRLLLRLYDEEQALAIHLLIDCSRSMLIHGKFDYARRIAAALCYIGLAHLDRVSLLPFGDHLGTTVPAGRATHTIVRVFDALAALQADGRTSLEQSVLELGRQQPTHGLAVVISDFLDAGADRAIGLLAAMGHEVFAIHTISTHDADDHALAGELCLIDAETGERRTLELTPAIVAEYRRVRDGHARDLASSCARVRAGYAQVIVEDPFERAILQTLRMRRLLE